MKFWSAWIYNWFFFFSANKPFFLIFGVWGSGRAKNNSQIMFIWKKIKNEGGGILTMYIKTFDQNLWGYQERKKAKQSYSNYKHKSHIFSEVFQTIKVTDIYSLTIILHNMLPSLFWFLCISKVLKFIFANKVTM